MNDAVIYLRKADLEKIEGEGYIELRIAKPINKGEFLRLEFDDEKDDYVPRSG